MGEELKLFVWENVLKGYTNGIMFALAKDVDAARTLIIEKHKKIDGFFSENLQNDLMNKPKIIKNAEGFFIWGGD